MSAGYSGTPLAKKLGIFEGTRFAVRASPDGFAATLGALPVGAEQLARVRASPDGFAATLGALPVGAEQLARVRAPLDVVVAFFTARAKLVAAWPALTRAVTPAGVVWVAWPKRSSGVPTDITENALREDLLSSGWVDNKVCAIDDTWSGLRFALRRELRSR